MRAIQGFERRLQGAVGNTFARLFGGTVQPAEVADALQREAADHIHHQGIRTIAPNHFRVRLGPTDREVLGADESSVATALTEMIREYLDEQGWQTFGDVAVSLEQSDSLHTGQFRISSIIDPDVDRRSRNSRAGVGRMTQQPADPPRDPQQPNRSEDNAQRPDQPGQPYGPPGYQQYGPPGSGQGHPGSGHPGPGPAGQGNPGPTNQPNYQQPYGGPGYGQQPWEQGQPWEQQYGQPPPGYPPYPPGPGGPPQPPQPPQPQQWDQQGYPQGTQGQPGQWDPRGQNYPPPYQPNYGQGYPQQYGAPQQDVSATLSVDDGSGRSYQLQRGSNVVGRGQDAAFRLPDTSVSRRHVDIYFDGQSAVLHDLGSTNGTTVNGSSVQTWQLADGDVIHIGHSTVVFSSRY